MRITNAKTYVKIDPDMEPNTRHLFPVDLKTFHGLMVGLKIKCPCGATLEAIGQPREDIYCACGAVYIVELSKCPRCRKGVAQITSIQQAAGAVSLMAMREQILRGLEK